MGMRCTLSNCNLSTTSSVILSSLIRSCFSTFSVSYELSVASVSLTLKNLTLLLLDCASILMFRVVCFCNCWSTVSSLAFMLSNSVFISFWIFLRSFASSVAHCSDFLNCVFSSFYDANWTLISSTRGQREINLSSFILISFRRSSYVSSFIVPSSFCWPPYWSSMKVASVDSSSVFELCSLCRFLLRSFLDSFGFSLSSFISFVRPRRK